MFVCNNTILEKHLIIVLKSWNNTYSCYKGLKGMCDEKPISKGRKRDEVVNTTVDFSTDIKKKRQVYNRTCTSKKAIEKLIERKEAIKCKDGIAQIDKYHPDYNFWMED